MNLSQRKVVWSNPSHLVYDRKLDVALRSSTTFSVLKKLQENTYNDWQTRAIDMLCQKYMPGVDYQTIRSDHNVFPKILSKMLSCNYIKHSDNWLSRAYQLAEDNVKVQQGYLLSSSTGQLNHDLNDTKFKVDVFDLPIEIRSLSKYLPVLDSMVTQIGLSDTHQPNMTTESKIQEMMKQNHFSILDIGLHVVWNQKVCVIQFSNTYYIYPRQYLLLIHNKVCDIFSVLNLAHLYSGRGLEVSCYNLTVSFVKSLINLANIHQNKYFHFAKVLEGLVTGMTLIDIDGPANNEFMKNICDTLLSDHGITIVTDEIVSILRTCSIPLRHELGCLSKIMGHPLVDMEKGTKKLHNNVTKPLEINEDLVADTLRACKRSFIKSYILRHHRWPLVECQKSIHKGLMHAILMNKDPDSIYITSRFGSLEPSEYDHLTLSKVLDFDWLENFIPYVKDKTISILRSKVVSQYIKHDPEKAKWKDTRCLLHYLLNSEIVTSHIPYVQRYMASSNLEDVLDYLVMRIVPKEKELKEVYRGFGCRTAMERARCSVQEYNTKVFLDLYSNEQATTLSELDILHRLNSFRNIHKAYPGYTPLYVVIDASAWNNHFRPESVDGVLRETLDRLFHVDLFCKTMMSYENTMFYVPDTNGTWHWYGQSGGIEGQNQDSWVLVYIGQIHTAMKSFNFPYHIFCKGDDMRVVVLLPPQVLETQPITEVKNSIVQRIEKVLGELGHKINIEESYASPVYFAFSKTASIKTIELPQSYRKIQKAYGANNAFLNLLDDYIGSSYSNCHSASKTSPNPICCYFIALIWSYYHLLQHDKYSKQSDIALVSLLLVPGLMGGFPIIFLHNFFTRAESDLLSPFIGLVQWIKKNYSQYIDTIESFLQITTDNSIQYFKGLLVDPYSLPIQKPSTAMTVLRMHVLPAIRHLTKNEHIKNLFRLQDLQVTEFLIKALYKANVYNAKVFSALYSASPDGILVELTRKFETGRSILDLLILRGGYKHGNRVLKKVLKADTKLNTYRLKKMAGFTFADKDLYQLIKPNECPGLLAQRIRDLLWGKRIESVTVAPLQHQIMLCYPGDGQDPIWDDNNHFTYMSRAPTTFVDSSKLPCFASSDIMPFIGFRTRNSMVPARLHFVEKDLILSKIKDLIDLISWTNYTSEDYQGTVVTSNLIDYIKYLLTLYLDVDPQKIVVFKSSKKSGTISHHIRSPNFRESIIPNMLGNLYQQWMSDSNTHTTLRSKGIHITLNFLHVMCHTVTLLSFPSMNRNEILNSRSYWAVTCNCRYCDSPIVESPIVLPKLEDCPQIEDLRISKLTANALRIVNESLRISKRKLQTKSRCDDYLTLSDAVSGVVQEFLYTTFIKRLHLLDWQVHQSITSDGYTVLQGLSTIGHSRTVGVTELARVPTKDLTMGVVMAIVEYFVDRHKAFSKYEIQDYMLQNRAQDTPWFFLVSKLRMSGRLHHVLLEIYRITKVPPPPTTTDLYEATRYIGGTVLQAIENYHQLPSIVHLSMYELSHVASLVIPRTKYILMKIKNEVCHPDHNARVLYINVLDLMELYILQNIPEPLLDTAEFGVYEFDPLDMKRFLETEDVQDIITPDESLHPHLTIEKINEIYWDAIGYKETMLTIHESSRSMRCIRIVYTELETCVRLVRDADRESVFDDIRVALPVSYDLPDIINVKTDIYLTIMPPAKINEFVHSKPLLNYNKKELPTSSLIVRPNYFYRHLDQGSTGVNKCNNIFEMLQIKHLPESQYYLCLAEGSGGFCCSILSRTKNSIVVYNTLKLNPDSEEIPLVALQYATRNGNSIDLHLMNQGYDDLGADRTMMKLVNLEVRCPIITCDLNHVNEYEKIITNCCLIMVSCLTTNGIGILKVFLDEEDVCLKVIAYLQSKTRRLMLYKPPSSCANQETYIIMIGLLNHNCQVRFDCYPDIKTTRAFIHHDKIIQDLVLRTTLKNRVIHLQRQHDSSTQWIPTMESHFYLLYSKRCPNFMDVNLFMVYIRQPDGMRKVIDYIVNLGSVVKRLINKRQHDAAEDIAWSIDTLNKKTKLAELYLFYKGTIYVVNKYLDNKIDFSERDMRSNYSESICELPRRFSWLPVTSSHFKDNTVNSSGYMSHPYLNYVTGIETGLSLLGYVQYIQQHLKNQP